MRQCSTRPHRREQWQEQATQHGKGERDARREQARITAERDPLPRTRKASQPRGRAREAPLDGRAMRPTVDVVHCALPLF